MIRRPPRSTLSSSSAASDVYKRQVLSYKYGVPQSASYELELALSGLLKASKHLVVDEPIPENNFEEMMSEMLSLIHISEPTRLRRISYAVFCLKKKKKKKTNNIDDTKSLIKHVRKKQNKRE